MGGESEKEDEKLSLVGEKCILKEAEKDKEKLEKRAEMIKWFDEITQDKILLKLFIMTKRDIFNFD